MAFTFTCPQGHELQADEAHVGQTVQCPQCGTAFIIPSPQLVPPPTAGPPLAAGPPPAGDVGGGGLDGLPHLGARGSDRFGFLEESDTGTGKPTSMPEILAADAGPRSAFDPSGDSGERMVTVPCPNGHPVMMPYETMGAEILCPQCGEQFVLRYTDSYDYQYKEAMKQDIQDHKLGKTWFTWAVVAACAVVVLLIVLIVASAT